MSRNPVYMTVLVTFIALVAIQLLSGCPPSPPPATCSSLTCPAPNMCVNNVCTQSNCGLLGAACCPGSSCTVGTCNSVGVCQANCGLANQPCCPGGTCSFGTCNSGGICSTACGQLGQSCCNGTCQAGTCSPQGTCACAAPAACGNCGGVTQCDGSCSKATPPDFGTIRDYENAYEEAFSCCWIDYNKSFGGSCHPGWKYETVDITKISGGGTCELVSSGSGDSCRVTLRFHNNGLEGARCRILIRERRLCGP
jgi:hypothetical protein